MRRILVINGPNLNLLGTRSPEVYGHTTAARLKTLVGEWGEAHDLEIEWHQSNHEGVLIDRLHDSRADGIVLNAGALTHYSYALADAIDAIEPPVVEVHISNILEREPWRRTSVIAPGCVHSIYGRGVEGYRWALSHLANRFSWPATRLEYGPHPDNFGDLRLPETPGPWPLVVLVHGGFWRHQWTHDTTEAIAVDLARRGFATFNTEYRRVGMGGGAATTPQDLDALVRAVRSFGQFTHLVLMGHSAGGHLAALAAARNPGVDVVVSLAGVLDLAEAVANGVGSGAADLFLEGEEAASFSPTHLLPISSRFILAHGERDESVPPSQSLGFADAARSHGVPVETIIERHLGHFELIDPHHPVWEKVVEALGRALGR
jgi:3-dehydroquinate dehydratase type II